MGNTPLPNDDRSALEEAREHLYAPRGNARPAARERGEPPARALRHAWEADPLSGVYGQRRRRMRFAAIFFGVAVAFFVVALVVAAYLFSVGGVSVSVNHVAIGIHGPSSVAGGDVVPLSLSVTNTNPVALENAQLEVDFPPGTRSAGSLAEYPRFVDTLGTIGSGATVTRSVKAVLFGASGATLSVPVSLSYSASGSNAVFVKKAAYALSISSAPLSVSIDAPAETVSGAPLTLTLSVRNNAIAPLPHVVLSGDLPLGFSLASSSAPRTGSSFILGTLAPGASETIALSGALLGNDREERVFHFTVGTAKGEGDPTIALPYMTQQASVSIAAPFIATTLALDGASAAAATLSPGARHSATISYRNTLSTSVANAVVAVTLSGAIDYSSIQTTGGFYRSSDHTVLFGSDTDPALAALAPGAAGLGSFSFSTLPPDPAQRSPQAVFTVSVSGTRLGQANVPESVSASATYAAKVTTAVNFSTAAFHIAGPFSNTGPIPPKADAPTTYTIEWVARNLGSALADARVQARLPSYVAFVGGARGDGSVSYDAASRTVTWSAGDIGQGAHTQTAFKISLTPSASQRGSTPTLVGTAAFSGHDRYAGVDISASADAVSTETVGDPGYAPSDATVQ